MSATGTEGCRDTVAERNRKLLQSGKRSDYTIQCKGREFKVHKFILQNAGGYFEGAFNEAFQETTAGVISLDHCDPEAVHAMLQYIYHDNYFTHECSKADKVDRLIFHAKVDGLAKRMLLGGLQDRAVDHLEYDLTLYEDPKTLATALCKVIEYTYEDAAASGDKFRTKLAECVANQAFLKPDPKVSSSLQWSETFKEEHPFAIDLLQHKRDAPNTADEVTTLHCDNCNEEIWTMADSFIPGLNCPFCNREHIPSPMQMQENRKIFDP